MAVNVPLPRKCSKWTEEEIKILVDNYNIIGLLETSYLLPNRTLAAVQSKARDLKLQKPKEPSVGAKALKLRYKFGLEMDDYKKMFDEQQGVCAICGKPETELHQTGVPLSLSVDHDHKTNKVRGLLCRKCNLMIANADENYVTLINAVYYLEKYRGS